MTSTVVARRLAEESDNWGDAVASSATRFVVIGVLVVAVVIAVALLAMSGGARQRARARFVDEPLRHQPTSDEETTWQPDAAAWHALDARDSLDPDEG